MFDGDYFLHHGDCIKHMPTLPDGAFDFAVFSPPFPSLYAYTASEADIVPVNESLPGRMNVARSAGGGVDSEALRVSARGNFRDGEAKLNRRHWYHCSSDDHGQIWRPSIRRAPEHRSEKEPLTPRLCVCPTVAGCFAARLFNQGRPVRVYRTVKERRAVAPKSVWDAVVTGERWLIPPVEMEVVAIIDAETVERAICAPRLYHRLTRQPCGWYRRLAMYGIAASIIGPLFPARRDRTIAEIAAKQLGTKDFEGFFIDSLLTFMESRQSA